MTAAYIDSSVVIATAFNEAGISKLTDSIYNCDSFVSSNLLEAEVRSVFSRQRVPIPESLLHGIAWIFPERPLTQELSTTLEEGGYLRGADLWHVACALYAMVVPSEAFFLTLDRQQSSVARKLGFRTIELESD